MLKIIFLGGFFFIVYAAYILSSADISFNQDMPLNQALDVLIKTIQYESPEDCLKMIERYENCFDFRAICDHNNSTLLQLTLNREVSSPQLLSKIIELSEPLDFLHKNKFGRGLLDEVCDGDINHEYLLDIRKKIIQLYINDATQSIEKWLLPEQRIKKAETTKQQKNIKNKRKKNKKLEMLAVPSELTYSVHFEEELYDSPERKIPCIKSYNSAEIISPRVPLEKKRQLTLAQRYKSSPQLRNRDLDT